MDDHLPGKRRHLDAAQSDSGTSRWHLAMPAEFGQRYAGEDVGCAILGAVSELDASAGRDLATTQGVRDDNKACRHLAQRIQGQAR